MSRRVLDSNRLINHWRLRESEKGSGETVPEVWADELIRLHRTRLIVSPVYLEFLVHADSSDRVKLYERFLSRFEILDGWEIRSADLTEALRLARWIPRNRRHRKPRQLGDCLIKAIANRFGCEVDTAERDFPR